MGKSELIHWCSVFTNSSKMLMISFLCIVGLEAMNARLILWPRRYWRVWKYGPSLWTYFKSWVSSVSTGYNIAIAMLTSPSAGVPAFRNAVLQQKPMLLYTLLTRATESDSAFEKVMIELCMCSDYPLTYFSLLLHVYLSFLRLWRLQFLRSSLNFLRNYWNMPFGHCLQRLSGQSIKS